MGNEFKGYSLFNDVKSVKLRTWNRCVTMANINQDQGQAIAEGYANCFSEEERNEMTGLLLNISLKGAKTVRDELGL